jgi:hypothetical protein
MTTTQQHDRTMTATADLDLFDAPDFAPERTTLPWMQVLHNEDPGKAGLFITNENIESANIEVPSAWRQFKARFKSGEVDKSTGKFVPATAEGYLFSRARMLVLRSGALSMFSKRSGNNSENYLGSFDYKVYESQRSNLTLKTKHLIYLLSDDNQLLHQSPLQFSTKGCFGATFAEHLKAFQTELQKAYGKPRKQKFLACGVFDFTVAPELRGTPPDTAWVTVIESHSAPTKDNWREQYFVGYDDELREKLLADYETYADFDKKQQAEVEREPVVDPSTGEILTHPMQLDAPEPDADGVIPW